jgi:tetratricopeptide (TPR) repeat protein
VETQVMNRTINHRRIAVALSFGTIAGAALLAPAPAQAQEGGRMRILAPALAPEGGARDDFGKKVAEEFRKEVDKLATHAPFEGRELRDALKKYDVKEEELSAQQCVKARQLAGLIQIPLVMCGSYTPSGDGMAVTATIISPQTSDMFTLEPFTASDPRQAAQQIIAQFTDFTVALSNAGYCGQSLESQQWAQALEQCNKSLEANPTGKSALYGKAMALWKMDSLQTALSVFQQIIELDPGHQEALYSAGIVATSLEQRDIASRYFHEYLALNPGNAAVRLTVAGEAAKAGDPETALGIVEEGLSGDSVDIALFQYAGQLATAAAMKKSNESGAQDELSPEARALFEKSFEYLSKVMDEKGAEADASMVSNMVIVLNKLDRHQETIELARRAQAQNIDVDTNFWLAFAESLKESGDLNGAIAALESAVAKDPEARVNARIAVWLIQEGRIADAAAPAKRAVDRGEMDGNELSRMIAGMGFRDKAQKEQHGEAIQYYEIARQFATDEAAKGYVNYFHGYSVLKQAIAAQEPSTLASARASLPMFQRAKSLLQSATGLPAEQQRSRAQLIDQTDQFIEIQELLIQRGR